MTPYTVHVGYPTLGYTVGLNRVGLACQIGQGDLVMSGQFFAFFAYTLHMLTHMDNCLKKKKNTCITGKEAVLAL